MKGTRKFQKDGIPYEELTQIKFHNLDTGKFYRIHLIEPVAPEDLEKIGPSLLESEITPDRAGEEVIGGFTEYPISEAPPAFQGIFATYRREIVREIQCKGVEGHLQDLLERILGDENTEANWKLFGIDSEIEFPYGEIIKDRDGSDFELVGGTPPHKPASTGFVRVVDTQGNKHEFYPHVFKLEWRRVAVS